MELLLLVFVLGFACGAEPLDDPPESSPPADEEGAAPADTGADPASQDSTQVVVEIRSDLDALRCFLLHEREKKEGRAPKDWVQPTMEEYEKSKLHPCKLLPGFKDPKEEARKLLEQQQEQRHQEQEHPVPVSAGRLDLSPLNRP